ncbi:MAG TPA: BrnT family toxin [Devosia sp.]|jgi:hypothetical protein|nr:BrnT family toxin [Devosia sp.]
MDRFVWDDAKNAENIALRGFGLDIVYLLDWSAVVFREDTRFDYGESRLVVMGRIEKKPYYVVIVPRDGTIRVLSARRMHEKEAHRYGV